ncbi:MAG: iron-sulfur cluster repair di-iron protein [Bacteroidetes bacterium]|nr:iron-sulfur cluster repair di-iron protein [Bacteroidota bacterium]
MNSENNFLTEQEVYHHLTLSQIVTKDHRAAGVFEKYNLDFCCKGNKSLGEACKEKGLNAEEILSELQSVNIVPNENNLRFNDWELDFLVDYIINNHHQYVKDSIPVVSAHANKVASVHGKNHPETIELNKIFTVVYKDLKQHLMKEEEILFPYIKYLVKVKNNNSNPERPYFGTIANPIKLMESEHTSAGDNLFSIRKLTDNYTLPADACTTYTTYYKELKEFEEDLHKHVYLENSILFPKAIMLEEKIFNS